MLSVESHICIIVEIYMCVVCRSDSVIRDITNEVCFALDPLTVSARSIIHCQLIELFIIVSVTVVEEI